MSIILVCSLPRSGTSYTTKLMQEAGFDFLHEGIGGDGGCGYNLGPTEHCVARVDLEALRPTFLHQIRHPLHVCASLYALPGVTETFVRKNMTKEIGPEVHQRRGLLLFISYWLHWNKCLEEFCDWGFRVEDLIVGHPIYDEFFYYVGWYQGMGDLPATTPPINLGTRKSHEDYRVGLTWDVLRNEIPLGLYTEVREYASRFAYYGD